MARIFNPFRLAPLALYRVVGASTACLLLFTGAYYDTIMNQALSVSATRILACGSVLVFVGASYRYAWVRAHMGSLALFTQLAVSGHLCVAMYTADLGAPETVGAYIFMSVNALVFHRVRLVVAYILVSCGAFIGTGFAVPEPLIRTEVFALQATMYCCFLIALVSLAVSARNDRGRLEIINSALFDQSSDGLIYGDLLGGTIQGMNARARELFGSHDKLQVARLLRASHRRVYADVTPHDLVRQLQVNGEVHETLRMQTAAGHSFWGDMVLRRLDIEDEDILMIRISDVTERMEGETRLLEAQLLLDRVQTLARVGGWEYGADGDWHLTDSARALLGLPIDTEIHGFEQFQMDLGPETTLRRALQLCLAHAKPFDFELRMRNRDGHSLLVRVMGEAIAQGPEITKVVGMFCDVTDDRKREQELRDARDAAEAAAQARTQFLANVSHEIRTPMNGIIGMTSLLLASELSAEQREQMTAINSSGKHLLRLINELLDVVKIDARQMVIEHVAYNLGELVEDTVAPLKPLFAEKALAFDLTWEDPALPARRVMGDPLRTRQIITNLLSNALKFTEEGQVTLSIALTATTPERLRIDVTDTGIGIDPEQLAAAVRSLPPGGRLHHAQLRRHGAGACHLQKPRGAHGRRAVRAQRGRGRLDLYPAAAGNRGARGGRSGAEGCGGSAGAVASARAGRRRQRGKSEGCTADLETLERHRGACRGRRGGGAGGAHQTFRHRLHGHADAAARRPAGHAADPRPARHRTAGDHRDDGELAARGQTGLPRGGYGCLPRQARAVRGRGGVAGGPSNAAGARRGPGPAPGVGTQLPPARENTRRMLKLSLPALTSTVTVSCCASLDRV